MKQRLDKLMLSRGLVGSRSEAENWIRLGRVRVGGRAAAKPGLFVDESASIELAVSERYVSRAGLKLAGAAKTFNLNFRGKTVLDVGSSTGGFTDFALQHDAKKVYAVDVGRRQIGRATEVRMPKANVSRQDSFGCRQQHWRLY